MVAITSLPSLKILTVEEVRALKSRLGTSMHKQIFLRAIVGSMSEREVTGLERRIEAMSEVDENER